MRKRLLLLFIFVSLLVGWSAWPAFAAQSHELTERRTDTQSGYRIDYVDNNGTITLATDKGYASVVRVVEDGQIVEEYYFDENGVPIDVSGYYGRVNLYEEGRCIQITYLDKEGQPTNNNSGYAIVKRVVDERGHVVQEMYYDYEGKLTRLDSGQSGMRRELFDEKDRVTQFTYIDADGNPVMLTAGYSTVRRSYDATGKVEADMYFDTEGNPAEATLGQYGIRYVRDEDGKHIATTYLDRYGRPMVNNLGYVTVAYAYDEWNNIIQQLYYDAEGQLTALSRGQYGQRFEYERKEQIGSYYIDAEGNELFLLDQFLHQNLLFNIIAAVLLVLCAQYLPKTARKGLLIAYVVFILYMTLMVRESSEQEINMELFWSYKQFFTSDTLRVEIVHNILLFVPLGALICSLNPRLAWICVLLLLSVLIESTQYVFHLGLCELDDVLSNGMGGGIGWLLMRGAGRLRSYMSKKRGRKS